MKIKKIREIFILFFFIAIFSFILISSEDISSRELTKGKNNLTLNLTELIYVETLIKLNPDIDAISYRKEETTIGYVNFLGGIGENFVVENREYEIIVSKNIDLVLPEK